MQGAGFLGKVYEQAMIRELALSGASGVHLALLINFQTPLSVMEANPAGPVACTDRHKQILPSYFRGQYSSGRV